MSDRDALMAAIIANPDDDTPRLMYADWLDEHLPDKTPSPAAGPSARAEYIRVQCRLARFPFDDPDYAELLEREEDLSAWLMTHAAEDEPDPELPDDLEWYGGFDSGEWRTYRRGFPGQVEYSDFNDKPEENVDRMVEALPEAFARTTIRSLMLEDAYGEEVAGLLNHPVAAGLRGLDLSDIGEHEGSTEDDAIRAIANSPHLGELRRLELDFYVNDDELMELAKSNGLGSLESLSLNYPGAAGLWALGSARWFRNLRSLRMSVDNRDVLKAIADFPAMPNLVELELRGSVSPTGAAVQGFAASKSFPQLKKLGLTSTRLMLYQIAALARGPWALRHLRLDNVTVRKSGAEALAGAAFAGTLRVLELPNCDITAGGVQALAASAKLAGLQHLDLSNNPVGVGGLAALARSPHLRGLRSLSLANCNTAKPAPDAAGVHQFLTALEMPELRHLRLNRLPVGVRGARVIAGGAFPNLTRLDLQECGLRENGARAIVESPALANLAVLDLSGNAAGKGVSKLANSKVFPRLARADVSLNRVQSSTLSRLRKRAGVHV